VSGAFALAAASESTVLVAVGAVAVAVVLLIALVVMARRRHKESAEVGFLRDLADSPRLADAMHRALEAARALPGADAALISAGDAAEEQTAEAVGMTQTEAEAHRFGHGRRIRSVLVEVESEDGEPEAVELDQEDVDDGELERVSEDGRIRSMLIRYELGGETEAGEPAPIAAGLAVPIRSQDDPVGVLSIFSRTPGTSFSEDELVALETIARRVAPFVEARLQAYVDELTNLTNFRFFRQTLDHEVAAAQRYGHRLGLLAFDLDGFKQINDTPGLGHAAGDTVLQAVAALARRVVRRSDVTCRKGGDEFVVILREAGLDAADLLYRRLQRAVTGLRVEYAGQVVVPAGVSAGAVELRREDSADSLFGRADQALIRAKTWGKGRVAWGEGDRSTPPPEARYGAGAPERACAGCLQFRPGRRASGYCERWHAPVDADAACLSFEPGEHR